MPLLFFEAIVSFFSTFGNRRGGVRLEKRIARDVRNGHDRFN